jgi:hypothetical protein
MAPSAGMSCELKENSVRINMDLGVPFKRTIRVPHSYQTSALPPDLGQFPLKPISQYADKLPKDIAAKGGLILPIHRKLCGSVLYVYLRNSGQQTVESEAIWIDFKCASHNACLIKIYCGGINAISGEPAVETVATRMNRLRRLTSLEKPDHRYDYDSDSNFESDSGFSSDPKNIDNASPLQAHVVVPSQIWLDGMADSDSTVHQFVAMAFNSGHSMEFQTTSADAVGGLQFEITPAQVP